MPEDEDPKDRESEADERGEGREDDGRKARFRGVLGDLLDSGQAFRRGGDLVAGVAQGTQEAISTVAQGTKEEIVRIISGEVRGFLDKLEAADLVQEIVAGLVIDVNAQIRFSRDAAGGLKPEITGDPKILTRDDADAARDEDSRGKPDAPADTGPDAG